MSSQQPKTPNNATDVVPPRTASPKTTKTATPNIPTTPSTPQNPRKSNVVDLTNMNFEDILPVQTPQSSSQATSNISLSQIMANVGHVKALIKLTDESQKSIAEKDRTIELLKDQAIKSREHATNATQAAIVFGNEIKVKTQKIEEKEQEIKNIKVQLENVNIQLETVNKQLVTAKKSETGRGALLKQYEAKIQDLEAKNMAAIKELSSNKTYLKTLETQRDDFKRTLAETEKKYNELEEKYDEVLEENVELKMDTEGNNVDNDEEKDLMKRGIQELERRLQYIQDEKKNLEASLKSKSEAEKARLNELQAVKAAYMKQQEDYKKISKEFKAVQNDLIAAKKEIEQLKLSKSKSTASGSSSPSSIKNSLPLATDQKILKKLRAWKVDIDRLRSENKYFKARNQQLSEQLANNQNLDTLLASSSSEAEDEMDTNINIDFNADIDFQDIMMQDIGQESQHPLSTLTAHATIASPTQISLPAPAITSPKLTLSPSTHPKLALPSSRTSSPTSIALPPSTSASPKQIIPPSPTAASPERRRSSGSSMSSRSSGSRTPSIYIPQEYARQSMLKLHSLPSASSAKPSSVSKFQPTTTSATRTMTEELIEVDPSNVPRTSSGLIPPPPNIPLISTSTKHGSKKRVQLRGVKPGSTLSKFVNSSNPAKLLKNNKPLILNTQTSLISAPSSPASASSPKASTQSSPILTPASPLAAKRSFSVSSTDEQSSVAVSPPPPATTTAQDTSASKKQKIETEYIKQIEGWLKSNNVPPSSEVTVHKLDKYLREISTTYQQTKTSLDPDVKRLVAFGIKGKFEINAPGVWDRREKSYAWYLSYASSLDPGNFDYIMQKLLNEITHGIKIKKLEGFNIRLVRLVTLICKSLNKVDIMKSLIYDIIRWSGSQCNVIYCLLNIAVAWKDPLVIDQNSTTLTKSVQICANFIAKQTDIPNTTKTMYEKLVTVLGWPSETSSMVDFIDGSLDHLKTLNQFDENEKDELIKTFELSFATMNDWEKTYSNFILSKFWPLMSVDNIDELVLELIGKLTLLGKSNDPLIPEQPGVDFIRNTMNGIISIENPDEGEAKLQAIARKYITQL